MTIHLIGSPLVAECDTCGAICEADPGQDLKSFVADLKATGCSFEKWYTEWFHYCPDCTTARQNRKPNMSKLAAGLK